MTGACYSAAALQTEECLFYTITDDCEYVFTLENLKTLEDYRSLLSISQRCAEKRWILRHKEADSSVMRKREEKQMMKTTRSNQTKKRREKKKKTNIFLCSRRRKALQRRSHTHTHFDMSLPDLLTSGASSSSSSLPACSALLCSSTATTSLTESCSLLSDKLHPQKSEMSREGGRAGRSDWGRLPPLVAAVGSVIGAEKPKDKHWALRWKTGPKCLLV